MHRRRLLAVVAGASLVVGACSSDDDDAAPAPSIASTAGSATPVTQPAAPTTTATAATTSGSPGGATSTSPVATSANPPPPTRAEGTAASSTTAPPTPAERLSGRIPSRDELGIPADWLDRRLTSDLSDVPADEVDPFNGLLTCPGGPMVPTDSDLWVEHRYTGTEPADDMISVRVVSHRRGRRRSSCTTRARGRL